MLLSLYLRCWLMMYHMRSLILLMKRHLRGHTKLWNTGVLIKICSILWKWIIRELYRRRVNYSYHRLGLITILLWINNGALILLVLNILWPVNYWIRTRWIENVRLRLLLRNGNRYLRMRLINTLELRDRINLRSHCFVSHSVHLVHVVLNLI